MDLATARAHPNIALVKYWGKRDRTLNLPSVPSLSVTLDGFVTTTTVEWGRERDRVVLDGQDASPGAARKVLAFLDLVDPGRPPCHVISSNSFPTAAGLASSSSAFAALAVAATRAAGQDLPPQALSVLARRGSGSACRSLFGGFVEWVRGERPDGLDSHGVPVAPQTWWDLRVVVAVVQGGPKEVGSTEGMIRTAGTSPCFPVFVEQAPGLVAQARTAVLARDLPALVEAMECSTLQMHGTMLTARPSLRYWKPGSLAVLDAVDRLRAQGVTCGWTMDAGPNVKVLCHASSAATVEAALAPLVERVHVLAAGAGAGLVGPAATGVQP